MTVNLCIICVLYKLSFPMSVDYAINFLAGAVSGATSVVVGHPLDTVKVRLQISDPSKYSSSMDVFRKMVASEGTASLFRGMLSPMLFASFINATVFSTYEHCLSFLEEGNSSCQPKYINLFISGAISAVPSCLILGPTDLIKIRLQKDSTEFKGPFDCCKQIYKQSGVRGLLQGTPATMAREIPSLGVYFCTYQYLKLKLEPIDEGLAPFIAGGCAGIASWVSVYPMDVIKTAVQAMPRTATSKEKSIITIFRSIVSQPSGLKSMYRGLAACIARSIPVNAVVFPAYESSNRLLNRLADGAGLRVNAKL